MGIVRTVCVCSAKNVLSEDIAVILLCTALYFHTKSSHALYIQYKTVSSMFFNVLFYMGKVRTLCFTLQSMRVERRVFYSKISKRYCYVQHCSCTQKAAMHSMFNINEFQACFSTYYFTWKKCVQCAFASQRMRVERRGFYRMISQRFCYLKHLTCIQKVAMHCRFNRKEFHAGF